MEDTANKKPSKECKAPPMVARLLTGLFLFCLWQTREKRIAILYSFSNNFRAMNLSQVLRLFIVKVQSWKALILVL